MEAVRQPGRAVHVEIPADSVRAVFLQSLEGIYRVSFGFTHFLAVLILHMAQNDNVLIRSLVKEQGGFRQQGVEPSSCLVHRLGNKVRRELLLEEVFVLKRIMMLRERHRAGVKPAVDHFRHAVHGFAALRTLNGDLVDIGTVKLHCLRFLVAAHLIELLAASDGVHVSALALPDI